jgi:nitrogen fixation NifU-like protein
VPTLRHRHDPRLAPRQTHEEREVEALEPEVDSRWDRLVADLQREIEEQERALYSATVLEQARNPGNLGHMDAPDAQAIMTGWCGDTMEIHLRLNDHTIQEATFMTDGCGPSVACGNMLTTIVHGKALDVAGRISPDVLIRALDGLPEESAHCATLAVDTLRMAIDNAGSKKEETS